MSKAFRTIGTALGWLWARSAAGVALALIVAALFAGYEMGSAGAPDSSGDAATLDAAQAHDHGEHATIEDGVYTCSMHPSVRLSDPDANCPICGMDLIPVDGGEVGPERSDARLALSEAAVAASRVETAPVKRRFPTANVRLYGKVTYDQTSVARLTAYFPGRIDRLFVHYAGVPVNRGEHLAEVYSPELIAAFEELRQAARAAETTGDGSGIVRRSTRDTLRAAREKLRLFGLTDAQIEAVERGELDSDRLTIYAPIGGIVTDLAVREGDYVETGQELATVADLSRLWLDLEAYESQLPMLRWGQRVTFTVEARPGEVFEGQISFIEPSVDARTRTAAVRVAVDNRDRRLKPGMFASAVARARLGEHGVVADDDLAGKWVSPMHPTEIEDGPGQCNVCGMDLVPAETLESIAAAADADAPLVIPRSAVLFTGTRSVVYVEVPGAATPTYEAREVVLGPRAGDFYVVRAGVEVGERVVASGAFRVDSAMQISAKPSMMTPPSEPGATPEFELEPALDPSIDTGHEPERTEPVPDGFLGELGQVYNAYFDAQSALAADDLDGFNRAASELRAAIASVDGRALEGETRGAWRRAAEGLRVGGEIEDIEAARARFERMSEAAVLLERRFGHAGEETWHLAHCPMAFDFAGADWLQRGTEINNPYFGASMLRCGDITASFEPSGPEAARGEGSPHEGHDHD